jgi:hypothetical protein
MVKSTLFVVDCETASGYVLNVSKLAALGILENECVRLSWNVY